MRVPCLGVRGGLVRKRQMRRKRPRGVAGRGSVALLALTLPLMMSGVSGAGAADHLRFPSVVSVRHSVLSLVDFLTGRHAPVPALPEQESGTAAGKAHSVPAAVTRAVANATGHKPGKGAGQEPAYTAHGITSRKFTTGSRTHGFNSKTSVLVGSATTARSDLYKNADGSYTRKLFQDPVNYQKPSGSWAPINETLVQGSDDRWRESANSVGASFAADANSQTLGSLVSDDGAESVSFSLAGAASVTGEADGSSVTYAGILPDTDVTETATATGISESLTLDSASAGTSWVFPLDLTGLTATLNGDEVDLTNAAGTVVWVIPPAVASSGPVDMDSATPQASSQLTYQLVSYDGGVALEMTLDSSWLDAPGRVFPVTVDPTFKPNPTASTYVEADGSDDYTSDNSGADLLPSGYDDPYYAKDLLDFTGEVGDVIPDEHVTTATLYMVDSWAYQCTDSEPVYAYQVTGSWSASDDLTYPGPSTGDEDADWDATASSAACDNTSGEAGKGSWIGLGFTSDGLTLLNDWTLNDGTPNYGFEVNSSLSDVDGWKQFDSANDGTVPADDGGDCTGNCEPYLAMTYVADTPPQINSQYPPDNYNSATLTPELLASGNDPDDWPDGSSVQYKFQVYTSSGTQVATSGLIDDGDWTVPKGDLSWGTTYYWIVGWLPSTGSR
jgi:hypothetical protein